MSSITLSPNASGTAIFTVAAPGTSTNRTLTLPDASTTLVGTDATQTLTNKSIDASQLTGALPALDGSALTGFTATQIGAATAGLAAGEVGTYAFCNFTSLTTAAAGSTTAGSSLIFSNAQGANGSGTPTGTWRVMGRTSSTSAGSSASLFLRIS